MKKYKELLECFDGIHKNAEVFLGLRVLESFLKDNVTVTDDMSLDEFVTYLRDFLIIGGAIEDKDRMAHIVTIIHEGIEGKKKDSDSN